MKTKVKKVEEVRFYIKEPYVFKIKKFSADLVYPDYFFSGMPYVLGTPLSA
jgi:hypothetical protein